MNRYIFTAFCLVAVVNAIGPPPPPPNATTTNATSGSGSGSGSGSAMGSSMMMFSCISQDLQAPEGEVAVGSGPSYTKDTFASAPAYSCAENITQCVSILFLSDQRVSGGCYVADADWVVSQRVMCEPGENGVHVSLDGSFIYSCCDGSGCNDGQIFNSQEAAELYQPDCQSHEAEECVSEYVEAYGCMLTTIQIDEPSEDDRCTRYLRPGVSCLRPACQACNCGPPGSMPPPGCEDHCAPINLDDIPSKGCPSDKIGDGECDLFCMTKDALFDGGDCSTGPTTRGGLLRLLSRFDKDRNEVLSFRETLGMTEETERPRPSEDMFKMFDIKNKEDDEGLDWFELGLYVSEITPLDADDRKDMPRMTFMMDTAVNVMQLVDKNMDGVATMDEINSLFMLTPDQFDMIKGDSDEDKVTMMQLMKVLNVVSNGLMGRDQIDDVDVKMACMIAVALTDYNHDHKMSQGESKMLGFSGRMFKEVDDEDGMISGMELYEKIKEAGKHSCEGFRSVDMQEGELKYVASPLRFDDSVCNILVMPEWNYEKEDAMYIEPEPMSEASLRRKKSIRPRPPTLRNREALHRITRRKSMLEKKKTNVHDVRKKSALHKKLTSPRHLTRKLLSAHPPAPQENTEMMNPNVTYPFLVSLLTPQRICGFEEYVPDDFCETPPWVVYDMEMQSIAGPAGLMLEDTCLSEGTFEDIANNVPDSDGPTVVTPDDFKMSMYGELTDAFETTFSTSQDFPGGYKEFQGVVEFLYPNGVGPVILPQDIGDQGTVCRDSTTLSDLWWYKLTGLTTPGSGSGSGSPGGPPGGNATGPGGNATGSGSGSAMGSAPDPNCVPTSVVMMHIDQMNLTTTLTPLVQDYLCCGCASSSGSGSGGSLGSGSGPIRRRLLSQRNVPMDVEYQDLYHYCSGALIDKKWVLTAASCVEDAGSVVEHDSVKVGGMKRGDGKPIGIERVLVHPGFRTVDHMRSPLSEFDAALIELEEPVEGYEEFRPIRMYDGKDLGYSDCHQLMLKALGFPMEGDRSGAEVEWQYNSECDEEKEEELGYKGAVTPAMLCTINDDDAVDEPVMDIGGPLVAKPSDLIKDVPLTLVGVLSSKQPQRYMYTRVTAIRQWVLSTIGRHPMKKLSLTFSDLILPDAGLEVRAGSSHTVPCEGCEVEECDIEAGVWHDEGKGAMVLTVKMEQESMWSLEASLDIDGCGLEKEVRHPKPDEEPECKPCALEKIRWEDVTEMARKGKSFTGGLGAKAVHTFHNAYGVWVCLRDWDVEEQLACGAKPSQIVCFRYNEKEEKRSFDFYGMNDELLLVKEDQFDAAIMRELKGISTLRDPPMEEM
eukprot:CAMPEP_0181324916 /NCGR_PEP_ID=MMETSP1101-20121128/20632_1 /TAXON_ID=46948 /ORGANISM="Rhodomonas abbreviata, Strain Caron Lab Isolate" /LENGTH=1329 /DNA_ID=CAMNT_0023433159 /DNA_START=168 /DNA_END=4157 /DNA_ORIENTATION=-